MISLKITTESEENKIVCFTFILGIGKKKTAFASIYLDELDDWITLNSWTVKNHLNLRENGRGGGVCETQVKAGLNLKENWRRHKARRLPDLPESE